MTADPLEVPAADAPSAAWSAFVHSRCDDQFDRAHELVDQLKAGTTAGRDDILSRWNHIVLALHNAANAAALICQVHPDRTIRGQAESADQAAASLLTEIQLDWQLYDILACLDRDGLDEDAGRMLDQTLRDFQRSGVDRGDDERDRLRAIAVRATALSQDYERTVNDDVRTISVLPERLDGLPADFIESHPPGGDGRVVITTDYPDYYPVLNYCRDAPVRAALTKQFMNQGWPANDIVLRELIALRHERATILGYDDWPDFDAEIKMIGSGAAIARFIEQIATAAEKPGERDTETLLARLRQDRPDAARLLFSDVSFYTEAVRREQYDVDGQAVRAYFEFDQVRAGLLDVTGRLFGLEFVERIDVGRWHDDVTAYDVRAEGQVLGRIYLDLHPRQGKFKHAAHFPLMKGVDGIQLPQSSLLCNLPRGLMSHDDVVTLFHEFGHLIHAVVGGRQRWARFSGVATERDFIEAPSQMLEEWAWHPDVLRSFARNAAGEPIPTDLVGKMRAAHDFDKGRTVRMQMYLTAISYGIHHDRPDDLTAYIDDLAARYLTVDMVPGSRIHTSFGHLADEKYSSAYYTYMWSLVIAKDLFSAFDRDDLFDTDVSYRYRDTILARGGSKPAAQLVEEFLGRPHNAGAFNSWLTSSAGS